MKILTIEELRDTGLLQETNRQWFHPLGLALAIVIDAGEAARLEILDAREDPEGFVYNDGIMDPCKCDRFSEFMKRRHQVREDCLGFVIQPEPESPNKS